MRHEWPRHRSAGDGLHHRRFDFDKAMRIQRAAHRLHQFAALQKDFPHLGIDDQIDIALAIAEFYIGEFVPLAGHLGRGIACNFLS